MILQDYIKFQHSRFLTFVLVRCHVTFELRLFKFGKQILPPTIGVDRRCRVGLFKLRFYRAMHFSAKRGIAIACRLSVRLSVCL